MVVYEIILFYEDIGQCVKDQNENSFENKN